MNKKALLNSAGFASFLWLLFRAGSAYAQATNVTVGQIQSAANRGGDRSMSMLEMVYGGIVHNPLAGSSGGAGGGMIGDVFLVLNSCILAVGIVWAMYIFVSGLIGTGQDGEFLGQKKSSAWFVIRMFGGFCSLVPVFGGYCGAQVLILWGTMMGVGIANLSQDAAIAVVKSGGSMVGTPPSPSAVTLAKYLFEANLCAESANTAISNMPAEAGVAPDPAEYFSTLTGAGKVVLMNRVGLSCGGAELNLTPPAPMGSGPGYEEFAVYQPDPSVLYGPMMAAHQNALTAMQAALNSDAKRYVAAINNETSPPDPTDTINRAARAYEFSINQAINNSRGELNSLVSQIDGHLKQDGWVMMGAWYQTFAQANTQVNNLVNATASIVPGTDLSGLPYPQVYRKVMATYQQQSAQAASTSNDNGSGLTSNPVATLQASGTDPKSLFARIFSGQEMVKRAISLNSGNGNGGATNPLIGMKNTGDYILDAGWIALGSYVAIKALNGASDSNGGKLLEAGADIATLGSAGAIKGALKGALEGIAPFIVMGIVALFFFGVMLSVYIPMVPFVNWYGGIISWYAVVGEGMIASPLGGMAHLDGDGEGLGQRTTHFWIFQLNVMFRPVAMILGFILGGAGVVVLGTLLNSMFGVAMANAQYDSTTGLVSILGFIGLYVSLCLTVIHGCFSLIHVVPDNVFSWLGGQMASRLGGDTDERSKQVFIGGVQQGRGVAQSSMGAMGRSGPTPPSGPPGGSSGGPAV